MSYCEVLVPGPWWNTLTYTSGELLPGIGARVTVPIGSGERIGFVQSISDAPVEAKTKFTVRSLCTVLDPIPPFPPALWKLLEWGGNAFLCGTGELVRMASPSLLLSSKDPISLPPPESREIPGNPKERFFYSCDSAERWKFYCEILEESERFLVLFPEQGLAGDFWKQLPEQLRNSTLLWPSQGGKRLFTAWISARQSVPRGVVGGPGAVFAPLQGLETIIVDEESSGAYRSYKKPAINARTLAGKRARLENVSLLLAGRVPSSRIFLRGNPQSTERPSRQSIKFVDLRQGFASNSQGIDDALPLTEALFSETRKCLAAGKTALWLLDRKGYAGEIACDDCGAPVRCKSCGTVMAWEEKKERLNCSACGSSHPIPRICPVCRGNYLIGKRPGLEALFPVAQNLVSSDQTAIMMEDFRSAGKSRMRLLKEQLAPGGIVVGTRAALALCDILDTGFAGWIDADAEIRSVAFQAKFTVFSMVWESLWRGTNHKERVVLLQSRRPGYGWQKGIARGWSVFWAEELAERKELGLPPFSYLLEIKAPSPRLKTDMIARMEERRLSPMDPGEPPLLFWVATPSVAAVREILAPFFSIGCSRDGFPEVTVWID